MERDMMGTACTSAQAEYGDDTVRSGQGREVCVGMAK